MQKMLRVGIICNFYHPDVSGVTVVIDTLVRHLANCIEFRIFCKKAEVIKKQEDTASVSRYKSHILLSNLLTPVLGDYLHITSLCWTNLNLFSHFDVLHFHTLWPSSLFPLLRSKRFNIPIILSPHGQIDYMFERKWKSPYRYFVKRALEKADNVIVFNDHEKQQCLEFAPSSKVEIIPNGVDLTFDNQTSPNSFHGLKIKDRDKIVLFVGTANRRKGFHDIIETASKFDKIGCDDIKFVVIGELTPEFEQSNFPKNIILLGRLPSREVSCFYKRADVLILPSYSEGMPLVILEAMANGLPVISTNIGSIPSIVHEEHSGFIIKPGDAEMLGKKICHILNYPEEASKMGEAGKKLYEERFTGKRMALDHLELYQKLIVQEKK